MTPEAWAEQVRSGPVLLDGGLGTLLIAAGLEVGRAPEWWLLERPEEIAAIHDVYVEAGSDVIHAVTFGGSPTKLRAVGLEGRCQELTGLAVQLARQAAGGRALVAGDIGPCSLHLPPLGTAREEDLEEVFREQAQILAEAGADLLSIETMYDLREARAAVRAAAGTGLPVLASMTFESRPRGFFTIMGNPLVPSLQELAEAGAHAVGFNCSLTPAEMLPMVRPAAAELEVPLIAQPNAGQPRATPEGITYDADPDEFARHILEMVEHGARIVGGCCGSEPEFIRRIRQGLDRDRPAG